MKNNIKFIFSVLILTSIIISCVPSRQFDELKQRNQNCESERDGLKNTNEELTVKNTEMASEMQVLNKRLSSLGSDTSIMGNSYRILTTQYDKINQLYNELLEKQRQLRDGNIEETKKILIQLQLAQEDLQKREDELKELERALDKKKSELEQRNSRLIELENILKSKDAAVKSLKEKVSNALIGFEGEGLTVELKNGKVYVSLEEQLLFKSGKWDVDSRGVKALKKLSKVLEKNEEINIVVEGHTDDVPYIGSGQVKDNWDLSVKRATAIVKILLDNSRIDPKRITAAGRGEFMPIASGKTKEARQKNRRTEIILTPKLEELFQLLE